MKVRITDGGLRDEGLELGSIHEAQPMRQSCRSKSPRPDVVVLGPKLRGTVVVRSHQYENADADFAQVCAAHLFHELESQEWLRSVGVVAENLVVYFKPGVSKDESMASVREILERHGYQGCRVEFREAASCVFYPNFS